MKIIPILVAICLSPAAFAASFQNLGFDGPDLIGLPSPPHTGTGSAWMTPGWVLRQPIGHNYTQPFEENASILDRDYRNTRQPSNPPKAPVIGQFSLGIWPSAQPDSGSGVPPGFSLIQTGDIPGDSQSLRFLYAGPGDFRVYVGGAERLVHFTESVASSDPEVGSLDYYGVDVGLFAGKSAELRFEFFSFGNYPGQPGGPVPGWPDAKFHVLDDISFSPLPAVPEPATWALLGFGLGALLWRGRQP